MYSLSKLSEDHAKVICSWKYKGEYSVYNYPDWETVQKQKWVIADEVKRQTQFTGVVDEVGVLCGYFRFVKEENRVMLGLGLNPQRCGKGNGSEFMKLILGEFRCRYPGRILELEVRDFNQRAVKCYLSAGFQVVDRYFKDTPIGAGNFLRMRYIA